MSFTVRPPAPFRLDLTVFAGRRDSVTSVDRGESSVYKRVFVIASRPLEVAAEQVAPADAIAETAASASLSPTPRTARRMATATRW